jgi:hypothetical protein
MKLFDLMTSTGVLFTYSVNIPDPTEMQIVDFRIDSPFTDSANVLSVNVAALAVVGKSVEQTLVEHVEHYERIASGRESPEH